MNQYFTNLYHKKIDAHPFYLTVSITLVKAAHFTPRTKYTEKTYNYKQITKKLKIFPFDSICKANGDLTYN